MGRRAVLAAVAATALLCITIGLVVGCQAQGDSGQQAEGEMAPGSAQADAVGGISGSKEYEALSETVENGRDLGEDGVPGNIPASPEGIAEAMKPEVNVPREYGTSEAGVRYRKGIVTVLFEESCSEGRARQIVDELGGTFVEGWFDVPGSVGYVYATVFFDDLFDGGYDALDEKARAFEAYDEVYIAEVGSGAESESSSESAGGQSYLSQGRFQQAWDVQKCLGSVRVAIVDSGLQLTHEDLYGNLSYGYGALDACSALSGSVTTVGASPNTGGSLAELYAREREDAAI